MCLLLLASCVSASSYWEGSMISLCPISSSACIAPCFVPPLSSCLFLPQCTSVYSVCSSFTFICLCQGAFIPLGSKSSSALVSLYLPTFCSILLSAAQPPILPSPSRCSVSQDLSFQTCCPTYFFRICDY